MDKIITFLDAYLQKQVKKVSVRWKPMRCLIKQVY